MFVCMQMSCYQNERTYLLLSVVVADTSHLTDSRKQELTLSLEQMTPDVVKIQ